MKTLPTYGRVLLVVAILAAIVILLDIEWLLAAQTAHQMVDPGQGWQPAPLRPRTTTTNSFLPCLGEPGWIGPPAHPSREWLDHCDAIGKRTG